ncbi:MAG: hypothetical protein JXA81_02075 [Sedimentisphaerales bacterium]|nr:hypothetical protein [Sedimentisphaerales bacterium]
MKSIIKRLQNKLGTDRLSEIQIRAGEILRTSEGDPEKAERLYDLAKELGIPIDSSDVHCRHLNYTEMFDRINDWIKDRRAEKHTTINVWATCLSVLMAMVAVFVSIIIHYQTRRLLVPTERPLIAIIDSETKGSIINEGDKLQVTLRVMLKNIGKNPAENMRMRVWAAPIGSPDLLQKTRDNTLADTLYPNIQFTWKPTLTVPLKRIEEKLQAERKEIFFYLRMDYVDPFNSCKPYTQGFNLTYRIGDGSVGASTKEISDNFISQLKEIGAI